MAVDQSSEQCVVCLTGANTHACVPCGHQCVCSTCSLAFGDGLQVTQCPVCSEHVESTVEIFRSGRVRFAVGSDSKSARAASPATCARSRGHAALALAASSSPTSTTGFYTASSAPPAPWTSSSAASSSAAAATSSSLDALAVPSASVDPWAEFSLPGPPGGDLWAPGQLEASLAWEEAHSSVEDKRYYAVWRFGQDRDSAGVYATTSSAWYHEVVQWHGFANIKWRRLPTMGEAVAAYCYDARRHKVASAPEFFGV